MKVTPAFALFHTFVYLCYTLKNMLNEISVHTYCRSVHFVQWQGLLLAFGVPSMNVLCTTYFSKTGKIKRLKMPNRYSKIETENWNNLMLFKILDSWTFGAAVAPEITSTALKLVPCYFT